jgi:hypothetical protein
MTETENKIISQDKNGVFHVPDMPRAKSSNPFNYNEAQLQQKKIEILLSHDCEVLTPEEAEANPLGERENNNVMDLLESN